MSKETYEQVMIFMLLCTNGLVYFLTSYPRYNVREFANKLYPVIFIITILYLLGAVITNVRLRNATRKQVRKTKG